MVQKKRVLLVDDDPDLLMAFGKRLEAAGFEVLKAFDGQEAIDMVKAEQPDLIVLDLMLPKLSGFEVCATLKRGEGAREMPVILCTGKWQEMDSKLIRELGASAFFSKIQGTEPLIKKVKSLLGIEAPEENQPSPPV